MTVFGTEINELLGLVALYVGVPLNALVVVMLGWKWGHARYLRVLLHAFVSAAAVLLFALVFGPIFVNNDQPIPPLDTATTKLITRVAGVVIVTVPALLWLWIFGWRRG